MREGLHSNEVSIIKISKLNMAGWQKLSWFLLKNDKSYKALIYYLVGWNGVNMTPFAFFAKKQNNNNKKYARQN